jgi:hypothetical protein
MLTLTARRQNVTVMTVSSLRDHLDAISRPTCRFSVEKVRGDRVSIRSDFTLGGIRKHASVVLPAYPTGCPNDSPCHNLNVVLDVLEFVGTDTCAERDMFAPLLGEEALTHYEKMHQQQGLHMTRCC